MTHSKDDSRDAWKARADAAEQQVAALTKERDHLLTVSENEAIAHYEQEAVLHQHLRAKVEAWNNIRFPAATTYYDCADELVALLDAFVPAPLQTGENQ